MRFARMDGGLLSTMVVDLESIVEGERFEKAAAYNDNGVLAREAVVFF